MSDLARSDTKFRVPLTLCDQKRITPYNTDTFSRYKATRKWKKHPGYMVDETRNSQNQNCSKSMEHGSENCKFESERVLVHDVVKKRPILSVSSMTFC